MRTLKLTGTFKLLTLAAVVLSVLNPAVVFGQKPLWQINIDWAANDTGHPNCVHLYLNNPVLQPCLVYGNRYCVTDIAIEAAYRNMDALALYLMAEITQCHNSDARATLYEAGPAAVGNYLRTFDRPAWTGLIRLE